MDGFIVIDKPVGVTSHDVVRSVRKLLSLKKVGHTGTLDPFATGVLPVAMGEGTKAIPFLDETVKEYVGVMKLGEATDTQDCEGKVIFQSNDWCDIEVDHIKTIMDCFTGVSYQLPPMYSALKQNGVPLYKLARQGIDVVRESRQILISSLIITEIALPKLTFTVRCSRGTYVRTIAHDIGMKLGCGAHLTSLRRTKSGPFLLHQAITLEKLRDLSLTNEFNQILISPFEALNHLRYLELNHEDAQKVSCGVIPTDLDYNQSAPCGPLVNDNVRLSTNGRLCAIMQTKPSRLIRVFN
jgi:tRNA pseudouridine55 synthase